MMWWITDPHRLKSEVAAVLALTAGSSSIRDRGRSLSQAGNLLVAVEVHIGEEWIPLTLSYPALFPATAPSVIPGANRLLSAHQYGPGGELCLEYRPDNWEPQFTGAMMLESAVRLLTTEAAPEAPPVPAAHRVSIGQELRQAGSRLVLSADAVAVLKSLSKDTDTLAVISEHMVPSSFLKYQYLAQILSVGEGEAAWTARGVVPGTKLDAVVIRTSIPALPKIYNEDDVRSACNVLGRPALADRILTGKACNLVVVTDGTIGAWWVWKCPEGKVSVLGYTNVEPAEDAATRLPEAYGALRNKAVGLVGCGSLGSKIAESLVRSGVGYLLLVDDDIVLRGNLVRQNYSGEFLGAHKADALKAQLLRINPEAQIHARRVHLGGQESGVTTSSVLEDFKSCDLIVDATADPTAFNLIASSVVSYRRPWVWGEVLPGGIGGFVARSRPEIDPAPTLVRRALAEWCETQDVRWPPEGSRAYEAIVEGRPMVADDADVAVIAAHMTRFALDLLVAAGRSKFPYSLYVVELSSEWIFKAPFETVALPMLGASGWAPTGNSAPEAERIKEALDYMATILDKAQDDEAPPAS